MTPDTAIATLHSTPFDYVCIWDFILLGLGLILRFLRSVSSHQKKHRLDFELSKYFDFKHVSRWLIHLVSSLIALMVLPEIFVKYIQPKYFDGFPIWSMFGSAVIGWLGYDIVRFIEKLYDRFIKRKNIID